MFKTTVTKPTSSLVQEPVRSTLFHAVTKVLTAFWHSSASTVSGKQSHEVSLAIVLCKEAFSMPMLRLTC